MPPALSSTDQVTAVLAVPVTVASKSWVPSAGRLTCVGLSATATTVGGASTVTAAVAVLVESALEVATTWNVPSACGAV